MSLNNCSSDSLLLQVVGKPALTATSHRVNTLLKAEACLVGREYSVTSFTLTLSDFLNSLTVHVESLTRYIRDFLWRIIATSFQISGFTMNGLRVDCG